MAHYTPVLKKREAVDSSQPPLINFLSGYCGTPTITKLGLVGVPTTASR
jgi:hypothetical protein